MPADRPEDPKGKGTPGEGNKTRSQHPGGTSDEIASASFTGTGQPTLPLPSQGVPWPEQDDLTGRTLSQYRILARLGEGGMGVVYKAQDTRLNRTVALKFLSPRLLADTDAKQRFLHEAQAAAGLDDPHICTVHEIHEAEGHTFIVMNYVEGESLQEKIKSGPLPIGEALDIARQIGRGLAKAHHQGIVHRDIKPGNVLLTSDGQVKIVDFGLAKLASRTQLTRTGTTMGTVAYMSPEQAQGEEVDRRTDIWALGVVLHEMLTGELPFRGENQQAVIHSILKKRPRTISSTRKDVSIGLERIVDRALAKNPGKRYPEVDRLLEELAAESKAIELSEGPGRFVGVQRLLRKRSVLYGVVGTVAAAGLTLGIMQYQARASVIDSLAVLPLKNLSGDAGQEFFSDGMTEALIGELGRIGALRVTSSTSVMHYKNGDTPLPAIARALNVDAILEGSIVRSGNQVEVNLRLIDPDRDQQFWSEKFERHVRDILTLRSEVARTVAREVRVKLSPQEKEHLDWSREVDPEAYDEYLKGLNVYTNKWNRAGADEAIDHFNRAVAIDDEFALPYMGIARAYSRVVAFYPRDEVIAKAIPAATRALELDPSLGGAYGALGTIKFVYEEDWVGPEREYRRALELSPNNFLVHHDYAFYLVLSGRTEEGFEHAERALELDPLTPTTNLFLGWAYLNGRRYEAALGQHKKTLEVLERNPGDPTTEAWVHYQMTLDYIFLGRYEAALEELKKIEGASPRSYERIWIRYLSGDRDGAMKAFKECDNCSIPFMTASIYALFGDNDQAFDWLNKAFDLHSPMMNWIKTMPLLDPIRSDPRYTELLDRAGIPL